MHSFSGLSVSTKSAISPFFGKPIVSLDRSFFKWAALAAVAVGSLSTVGSASAEVSWSIGIGGPVYYDPAPVYTAPPPVYYQPPPPREYYRPPPPAYYQPPPVYYGPPPVYYGGPDYRSGHHHHYHGRRGWDDNDDQD